MEVPHRSRNAFNDEVSVMQTPLQIAFEALPNNQTIEAWIREEAKKLDHMDEHITSARVVVAKPTKRHYTGDPYQIRIHLTVPGGADTSLRKLATGSFDQLGTWHQPRTSP